jgi:hypothetical protein
MNVILGNLGVDVEQTSAFSNEILQEFIRHPVLSHRIRRLYSLIEYRRTPLARPALIAREAYLRDEILAWWHYLYQISRWLGRIEVTVNIRAVSPCCSCLSCTSSWCDHCELIGVYTPICISCEEEGLDCPLCAGIANATAER